MIYMGDTTQYTAHQLLLSLSVLPLLPDDKVIRRKSPGLQVAMSTTKVGGGGGDPDPGGERRIYQLISAWLLL